MVRMVTKLQIGVEEIAKTQLETKSYVYKLYKKGYNPATEMETRDLDITFPVEEMDDLECLLTDAAGQNALVCKYLSYTIVFCKLNIKH